MDTTALIAVYPQSLRYSLQALLATLPPIKSVNSVADAAAAVAVAAALQPALAVLDMSLLGAEAENVLAQIKSVSPHTRYIVLVDNIEQQRAMIARAEAVLLKGFPAAELSTVIRHVLNRSDETPGQT